VLARPTYVGQVIEGISGGVGKTALGVAMVRARESQRPDRLFDDRYAEAFVRAAPHAFDREQRAAALSPEQSGQGARFALDVIVRTRFFDDYLEAATRAGIGQVVLLGAGLDTRAYRLGWPADTTIYELDQPGMLAFKQHVLDGQHAVPRCRRVTLGTDLRTAWGTGLLATGLARDQPTAWLAEGLLIYLSPDEASALLTGVGDLSPPGSQLAFEYHPDATRAIQARARQLPTMAEYTALWRGGLPNAPGWLAEHGWHTDRHDRASLAAHYGQTSTDPLTGGFITAVRPIANRQSAQFVRRTAHMHDLTRGP
jgi:methyltransferase (TIGR00027 family)